MVPVEALPLGKMRLEVGLTDNQRELVTVEVLIPPLREAQP